jgi:hypothetical protein
MAKEQWSAETLSSEKKAIRPGAPWNGTANMGQIRPPRRQRAMNSLDGKQPTAWLVISQYQG